MKVLLTGATGFIGSHVARALVRAGQDVSAIVRPRSSFWRIEDIKPRLHLVEGDLLDARFALPHSSFDACIHLAWYVEPGKYLTAQENTPWVAASLRLAQAVQESGCCRFIAAGTCFEYAPSETPLDETASTRPSSIYVNSKLELLDGLPSIGIEFAWLRFFYQYGPYEHPRRLVPVIINSLLKLQEVKLVPGERVRDYVFIEDVARAVCAVLHSKITGPVNIGGGEPTTVRAIASKLGDLLSHRELIKLGALPYAADEPMNLLADITKLQHETGWRPRVSLDAGLQQTIEWWKQRS